MDVSSFFSKLRKQVGFHRNDTDETASIDASHDQAAACDLAGEDDGYLVVGQTRSERNTVYQSTFSTQGGPNSPPCYGQVSNELPSYTSVLNGECTIVSGPSVFPNVQVSSLVSQNSLSPRHHITAISDVPFRLHESLAAHQSALATFHDLDLEPRSFNWVKYSHDFMQEKLCLRDLNCDEEANIEDFVTSTETSDMRPRDSEVDLIQL